MRTSLRRSVLASTLAVLSLAAAVSLLAQPARVTVAAPHGAGGLLRPSDRRRLRAAELHQVHRIRAAPRQGVRSDGRAVDRQDGRGPRAADGHHQRRRRTSSSSIATKRSRAASPAPRASTDDTARALAREGKAVIWIDGGLHATEVLGAQQLLETIWQFASKTDEETMRILRDTIILCRARQSRRHGTGVRLVHAQADAHRAQHRTDSAALPEVRRPRQQPRLLRDEPAGEHQHQPRALPRVVSRRSSTTTIRRARPAR